MGSNPYNYTLAVAINKLIGRALKHKLQVSFRSFVLKETWALNLSSPISISITNPSGTCSVRYRFSTEQVFRVVIIYSKQRLTRTEGMEAEQKRGKTKRVLVPNPRPGLDGPNAPGWYWQLRGPLSLVSVMNSDWLWQQSFHVRHFLHVWHFLDCSLLRPVG